MDVKAAEKKAVDDRPKLFGLFYVPSIIVTLLLLIPQGLTFWWSLQEAYRIRTYALTEYGMVIHEFDPWFNFRATQYLAKHGWHAFFHWFDYMSWYPLGRPVGTTIYPGLQITSVAIHRVLRWLGKPYQMTLNDICCTVPCWFGSIATVFLALITYEATGSLNAAVLSSVVMATIPAHIMRSVGGGYDNESIAMTAMLMTFYFWIRSLRTNQSWPIGIITGLAYGYMVAAWGGFIFVVNLIAMHAAAMAILDFLRNRFSHNLHRAYSLFFVIGTAIAVCVPPVNTTPFRSLEQLSALVVFIGFQALFVVDYKRRQIECEVLSKEGLKILFNVVVASAGGLFLVSAVLAPTGFFGPLSSRVRGLFVKHTRTGNPLVDSVAEHQPANEGSYWQYLHVGYNFWQASPPVIFLLPFLFPKRPIMPACVFLLVYSYVVYFFSLKMARLLILTGPIASASTGIILGLVLDWAVDQFFWVEESTSPSPTSGPSNAATAPPAEEKNRPSASGKDKTKGKHDASGLSDLAKSVSNIHKRALETYNDLRQVRVALVFVLLALSVTMGPQLYQSFHAHCENMAHAVSNPRIIIKGTLRNGQTVLIDDYREAYFWLRDKTPQDSRVMAWWDYGYQITGIGNRTSIADGNTWNHEHIATLGKCLTSPVPEAHSLIRHLADYVLVWAGGGGDDLAKSPHMARIGNSVYRDICPKEDPLCSHFGFYDQKHEKPTPMMKNSLLFNLAQHNIQSGIHVNQKLFKEVLTTKYGKVRIFQVMNVSQESKDWVADPANRICDAPGSWYCSGQFPPAPEIQALLRKRRAFGQLEDFNSQNKDDEYHRNYMKKMREVQGH